MRLSILEDLNYEPTWRKVKKFISRYGAELFQARQLTLGNVRAVLHCGIESFLDHLRESEDPLHPIRLLADLASGAVDRAEAVQLLNLIYGCLVERFDRFVEYNTTTTQSDYGEKLYCLLDFLRLEAEYERIAWELAPTVTAHEVLTRAGKADAARRWQQQIQRRTRVIAERLLQRLAQRQQEHGMQLPSLADRLNERFVKPLAVYTMAALVPKAVDDARNQQESEAFSRLQSEIDAYLNTTSGSNVEIPPWLWHLEREIQRVVGEVEGLIEPEAVPLELPPRRINMREMHRQLRIWNERLSGKSTRN
jgi:hypothetical protein